MSLPGTAFLALWNERALSREDYDVWHTREHVPQRLKIPGILAGQRYSHGEGPLPSYFTLYPLRDLSVIESPDYLAVLEQPTPWSLSMRPAMSDWYRQGCEVMMSLGGGVGGCLASILLKGEPQQEAAVASFSRISQSTAFCGLHLGRVRPVPALPFASSARELPQPDAVLLVEGFDWAVLRAALPELDVLINDAGYSRLVDWTCYRLAYAIDDADLESLFTVNAGTMSVRAQGDAGEGH